jgi:predicted O-linked N-acetylglucosamine transferase (SPINDLY family)
MFEKSRTYCEAILARQPDHPHALNNIAVACKAAGQMDEALAYARRAVAAAPDNAQIYSNLLLMMVYAASVEPQELAALSRRFGETIADKIPRRDHAHIDRAPDRKLRVGFVSPDFFNHAVNYFFEPLLLLRDKAQFEYYAYSNVFREDDVTQRLKTEFDHWRDIQFMSDDDVANAIIADGIDILVDLAGHTAHNRLLLFARKPAPVQVTWLGYPATTGMAAMDYRISDAYAEPPGMTEALNTEKLWRLPHIFCCYRPHENSPAVIEHPPFDDNGHITFGSFNNFAKVTDETLAAWTRIMAAVPDSRLLMEIGSLTEFQAAVEDKLRAAGLDLARVTLIPRAKKNQFVLYNRVDIALDPFPCCGGTTSMDTLWMGVPFITLAGKHFVSRMGVTILNNAGLSDMVAQSVDEYVDMVAALANDWERLRRVRTGLRERAAATPLMDGAAFARDMGDAFRAMWRAWCAT